MKSSGSRRIFTRTPSRPLISLGSIFLLLELGQKYLHPIHGTTGGVLRITFGVCGAICYLVALTVGPKIVSKYGSSRRKSVEPE